MEIPAVSIVIPMYNAEKYIGECLDSVFAQTFQDFEVIIVDDCSTDNGIEIVKNYAPKFDGRLTLTKTKENSGGGGYVPRNIGLRFSLGEYIFFLDADDFLVETALEILYTAATQYNADVTYTAAWYSYLDNDKFSLFLDDESILLKNEKLEDKITFIVDNPNKNLQQLLYKGNFRSPWTKFIRRKFLIENDIEFPKIVSGGDFIWSIHVFSCSRRFLRLPLALYFYRNYSAESVSRKKRSSPEQIHHWVSAFMVWLKALKELADKVEILKQNPNYCYQASILHFNYCLSCCYDDLNQFNNQDIYKILCCEFARENDPANLAVPFFFSSFDAQQKRLLALQRHIAKLENTLKNKE